ncbi:hypothetical protein, partial [Escherichia coli]|uniref:hypothetical protein n=1 Tax=Escherichia coli TaxID=562 RepID=UPI003FD12A5B
FQFGQFLPAIIKIASIYSFYPTGTAGHSITALRKCQHDISKTRYFFHAASNDVKVKLIIKKYIIIPSSH